MWKNVCCGAGLVVGFLTAVPTFFAYFARIESAGELEHLVGWDVVIGGAFAAALILTAVPNLPRASLGWSAVVVFAAGIVWLGVSTTLIRHHEEQFRVRSALPVSSKASE